MRKRSLDILRLFCVLLLIPFHTMMMYNTEGEGQYVPGVPSASAMWFVWLTWPWFMPMMFVIAGIAARYSLEKRGPARYAAERLARVGLPLLTGVVLLVSFMAYIADVTNNGYAGGCLAHFGVFFTKLTDLSGYDGGFGVSHLWFLLYLLLISLAALPVFLLAKQFPRFMNWDKWPLALILALGAAQAMAEDWLNISGKSLGQYFVLFLIGVFVLSRENAQAKLEKYRFPLLAALLFVGTWYVVAIRSQWSGPAYSVAYFYYGYLPVLACLGFGRRHLETHNATLLRAAGNSQLFYILHYPLLVAVAYLLMPHIAGVPLQIAVFIVTSFVLTVCVSEAVRRIPVARVLFGVKSPK